MKKVFFLFFILLSFHANDVFATHYAGGDITYRCIDSVTQTYEITVTVYRDCLGRNMRSFIDLDYSSSCRSNRTISLPRVNIVDITPLCPGFSSNCDGGFVPGIEQHIYRGNVTLPVRCQDWIFSITENNRNRAITTIQNPGGQDLHLEALLNNFNFNCNNSPTFTNFPIGFLCLNQSFSYNNGVFEQDGDSITFAQVVPKTDFNQTVQYLNPYTFQQPLTSIPPVTFDSLSGVIVMNPTMLEQTVFAVEIREYRNGILIGSVTRDLQVLTQVCNNNLPTTGGVGNSNSYDTVFCISRSSCFNIPSFDMDPMDSTFLSWDSTIVGATFTTQYVGNKQNATFCWQPTLADTANNPYIFTVTVKDNACPTPGLQVFTFSIFVVPPSIQITTIDTTICAGDSIFIHGAFRNTSGAFTDTLVGRLVCDSIRNINLTVNSHFLDTLQVEICDGDSFLFHGNYYKNTGFYAENFQTFLGCDSNYYLDLSVRPTYQVNLNQSICQGDSVVFAGNILTSSGVYSKNFSSFYSCDSLVTLNLTVHPEYYISIFDTICANEVSMLCGNSYSTSGIYRDTCQTIFGCDSMIELNLFVNPIYNHAVFDTICQGDSVIFNNQVYKQTGSYSQVFRSFGNCDSTVLLNLQVNPIYQNSINQSICQGDSVVFAGNILTSSGVYFQNFQTINGCDSSITLNLTVHPKYNISVFDTICANEISILCGNAFSTSGIYRDTCQTIFGCDSMIELNLFVNPIYNHVVFDTICQGDVSVLCGIPYNSTGIYNSICQSISGCDSSITLNLTVHPTYQTTLFDTICQGESRTICGNNYSSTGNFSDTCQSIFGCDSIVNLNLIVNPLFNIFLDTTLCQGETFRLGNQDFSADGFYQVRLNSVSGCDSLVNLNLAFTAPEPDLGLDSTLCDGLVRLLSPGNFESYLWKNGSTEKVIIANQPDEYWVQVWDSINCTAYDTILLEPCILIQIPSAFSPNNDQINDVFKPTYELQSQLHFYEMLIFNRWGERIFQSSEIDFGWDGRHQNEFVKSGLYNFIIYYQQNSKSQQHKIIGTISVLR